MKPILASNTFNFEFDPKQSNKIGLNSYQDVFKHEDPSYCKLNECTETKISAKPYDHSNILGNLEKPSFGWTINLSVPGPLEAHYLYTCKI